MQKRTRTTRLYLIPAARMMIGLSALLSLSAQLESADWPNWAGPGHDGISRETGFADSWPSEGLKPLWTKDIGIGFSSITVSENRLYSMGHVDGEEFVWCLDAITGDEVWKYSYPCQLLDNLHEGGPCSTPTIEGGRVYTLGKEGQLFCFDAKSGTILWQNDLQKLLDVKLPEWGFSSSPVILDERLLLEAGRVVSFDKLTGAIQWMTPVHEAGYGSVAVFTRADQTLLASLDCDGLRILSASDGKEIAFEPWNSPFQTNSTTPIVDGNYIYISTGYNIGCVLFEFADGMLKQVYKNQEMRNHFNNSLLYEGHLYGFDGNSHNSRVVTLRCTKFDTGEVLWTQRNLGCGSLTIVDGKLLILSEKGDLVLARAMPERFEELSRSTFLEGRCWTVPIVAGGRVYGRNAAGRLICTVLPRQSVARSAKQRPL